MASPSLSAVASGRSSRTSTENDAVAHCSSVSGTSNSCDFQSGPAASAATNGDARRPSTATQHNARCGALDPAAAFFNSDASPTTTINLAAAPGLRGVEIGGTFRTFDEAALTAWTPSEIGRDGAPESSWRAIMHFSSQASTSRRRAAAVARTDRKRKRRVSSTTLPACGRATTRDPSAALRAPFRRTFAGFPAYAHASLLKYVAEEPPARAPGLFVFRGIDEELGGSRVVRVLVAVRRRRRRVQVDRLGRQLLVFVLLFALVPTGNSSRVENEVLLTILAAPSRLSKCGRRERDVPTSVLDMSTRFRPRTQ